MQNAYIVNHGTSPYSEKWDGREISWAPGEKVEMERSEAVRLLGTFVAELKDGNGDTLRGKTLHLEEKGDPWAAKDAPTFISQIDGQDYGTEGALKAHYAEFQHIRLVRDVSEDVKETMKLTQTTGKTNIVYACHICEFQSNAKQGLVAHMRSHDAKPSTNEG